MSATNGTEAVTEARPARPLEGSRDARRMAALILETLGGLRTAQEASEAMGVALVRYYVLEARALQAMIGAMEPRPRGRKRSPEAEIEQLKAEVARLEREVLRYQALHRATQRAIGLPREEREPVAPKGARKKRRTVRARRKVSRGERVLPRIRPEEDAPAAAPGSETPSSVNSSEEVS